MTQACGTQPVPFTFVRRDLVGGIRASLSPRVAVSMALGVIDLKHFV
jgi:hypothetical protein